MNQKAVAHWLIQRPAGARSQSLTSETIKISWNA